MEFSEKLQQLRKNKGLTQEELAETLFVSRTAVSKWESGRGMPSIDSLKDIAKFFGVTIDELVSGETLLSLVGEENKRKMEKVFNTLFAVVDLFSVLFIVLPLYPNRVEGYVYSVNLWEYTKQFPGTWWLWVYWCIFLLLFVFGGVNLIVNGWTQKGKWLTNISLAFHIVLVIVLGLTRQVYGVVLAFGLLVMKTYFWMQQKK